MKNRLLSFLLITLFVYGCSSVPLTGRRQLSLVSDDQVLSLSLQQYGEYINTARKSTNQANIALVTRVGQNIANAVTAYLKANNAESILNGYAWEFNLIEDDQVNAFCMPGGKIVVYTGILPYTRDETGLAVVMGHEVAHAIAKHSNERMSQQVIAQYGSSAVDMVLENKPQAKAIGQTIYGLGAQYGVVLPFSRKQELEADHLGLIFMALAGYNPSEAPAFWQRMSQQGSSTPEFMSTHPSDATRISQIQEKLPEALQYYKGGITNKPNTTTNNQWRF